MAINSLSSTSTLNDLAAVITRKLDKDQDGKLSTEEFASFLARLMDTKTDGLNTTAVRPAATTGTPAKPAAADRPVVGTMGGFDPTKLADTKHQTFKYEIGRILQHYPNTPTGLKEAMVEIQKIVPGAKVVGSNGDKIDFGDFVDNRSFRIGVIDVLQAAGAGGKSWQWMPVE